MAEDKILCNNEVYKQIVFIPSIVFSFISLIGLILVLIEANKKTRKKSLITESLIAITIAEIINCISKLLYIPRATLRTKFEPQIGKYCYDIILGYIQMFFTIYSEFGTLISSLLLSYKIYKSTKNENSFFKKRSAVCIVRVISYVIPAVIAFIFVGIDYWKFTDDDVNPMILENEECKIWIWMYRRLSLIYYCFVVVFVILISIFSCMSISYLKRKKNEILQFEKENQEDFEDSDGVKEEEVASKGESILSQKITTAIKKIQYFPVVTCVVWLILSIDRIPDDIVLIVNEKHEKHQFEWEGAWLCVKMVTIILHNYTACIRGMIYFFTFFKTDSKLFTDMKEWLKKIFCCKKKPKELITVTSKEALTKFSEDIIETKVKNESMEEEE